jgi:hypothetical protein
MEPVDASDAEAESALSAGVAAVRATLEQQVREFYESFAADALSSKFSNPGYELEKAAAAACALCGHGQGDAIGYDIAISTALLDSLRAIRVGVVARRYDRHVYNDLDDAIYVLERLRHAADGDPSVDRRDLELLVRVALPRLVGSVQNLTREIDADFERREGGWYPDGSG